MEGAWVVAGQELTSFSEQFLQDGCSGDGSGPYGIPLPAAQTKGRIPSEDTYPTNITDCGVGEGCLVVATWAAQVTRIGP